MTLDLLRVRLLHPAPRPVWTSLLLVAMLFVACWAFRPRAEAVAAPPTTEAAPAAVPDTDDTEDWVESTLASLTLREQVAQLVFPWIRGGHIAPGSAEYARLRRWIAEDRVGGLIISRGTGSASAATLRAAQAMAGVPLLIVSDFETGPRMRLTDGTYFPPAMAFGATRSEALAREAGRATGREARAVGIHMTLGPVLDVNSNPRNPIINIRSFGEDPALVALLSSAWISGAREAGLLTAGKHFPGHGDTEVDSHIGLATISAGAERLSGTELVPFRAAITQGMDGVLVGHIAVTGVEGPAAPPASLSRTMIGGMLREQLAFDGLVITDALNMGAITRRYPVAEAAVLALAAGADVLLQPPGERAVIDAIVHAVESGRIPRHRIEESARRVLRAKAAAQLHRGAAGSRPPAVEAALLRSHAEVAQQVAGASVTLVRDRNSFVPVRPEARRILHVVYTASGTGFAAQGVSAALTASGRQVEVVTVGARTPAATFTTLAARAARADLVIASTHIVPREYIGSVGPAGGFSAFVEGLAAAGTPVVAISFGSPYLLSSFPSVPTYLLGWGGAAQSQRAVAQALLGRAPITGRLPVSLPPHHAAGEGIQRPALP